MTMRTHWVEKVHTFAWSSIVTIVILFRDVFPPRLK
jgi:hypothetical protein